MNGSNRRWSYRRLTEYEARLNHSHARPTATTEIGDERSDPMAAMGS